MLRRGGIRGSVLWGVKIQFAVREMAICRRCVAKSAIVVALTEEAMRMRVGCQNSVHAARNLRFAGRTLIWHPTGESRVAVRLVLSRVVE
jgi:hypothetical protein